MNCLTQKQLVEMAQVAASGEELTPRQAPALEHIHACEACKKNVAEYAQTAQGLRRIMGTVSTEERKPDCLSDEDLAAYADHAMAPDERELAETHLARCEVCLDQLSELAAIVNGNATSAFEYVIGLMRDGLKLLAHPEAGFTKLQTCEAVVLGPAQAEQHEIESTCRWTQMADAIELSFSTHYIDSAHVSIALGVNADPPLKGARFTLQREGTILQAEPIPADGRVLLQNLIAQRYEGRIDSLTGHEATFMLDIQTQEGGS